MRKTKIKKAPKTASAQIVAAVDDLLSRILLRVPIKPLVRFKLVSKRWNSLISNPQFCLLRNPNPNPPVGLILKRDIFSPRYPGHDYVLFFDKSAMNLPPFGEPLKFMPGDGRFGKRIWQSCNGLLLCSKFPREDDPTHYVCNPTTGKFSSLPRLSDTAGYKGIFGLILAFDPSKSPQYKVVCVRKAQLDVLDEFTYQLRVDVYSSETGAWKKCGEPFQVQYPIPTVVYWNGAIHFISFVRTDSWYFNLDDQIPRIMPMPPIPAVFEFRGTYYFGQSCDHLHFIEFFEPQIQFDVYEMKTDYSEWFVKYRVDLSPVVAAYPEMIRRDSGPEDWSYYAFWIPSVVRGVKEEDAFLVLRIPGKAVRYNLVNMTFETICEIEDDQFKFSLKFTRTMHTYVHMNILSLSVVSSPLVPATSLYDNSTFA